MNSEKFVLASMKASFDELRGLIRLIDFSENNRDIEQSKHLPAELSSYVANFLTVKRCDHSEAEAVAASSMDSMFKLERCMVDDQDSWWLSGFGSMPRGRGDEYVEVRLSKTNSLRRVQSVSMSIPPLPVGPLSVREFRLEVANQQGDWTQLPFEFQVQNESGMQRFPIGNVDATSIRVVCLSNQISPFLDSMESPNDMERVGFYAIKFE